MDFIDQLQALSAKIPKLCDLLQTEEATKNALVMPFIAALGYDIFDPTEVVPEFIADVGIKKGEKVDYAIKKDGKIIMLFECKHCGGDLNIHHAGQLFRYFAVTDARIAVLTNGVVYRFFTDLEAPNKMDDKPFLEVNMLELTEVTVAELKKLTNQAFNLDELMTSAGELKYTREVKRLLSEQIEAPSDEFVKLFAGKVFSGVLTPNRREYFGGIVKRSFNQLVSDRINDRLKSAMSGGAETIAAGGSASDSATATKDQTMPDGEGKKDGSIVTTSEEIEGYYIIKSLLREIIDPKRIVARDTQSYFGILLDDNNRKPLCRLHFNRAQKYVGLFDANKVEARAPIKELNDIYNFAGQLRESVAAYEKKPDQGGGVAAEG